jgi:hypothetical protein
LDAVDAGYRVILAEDALCSVSDESHNAMLRHFGSRFSQQIEVASLHDGMLTLKGEKKSESNGAHYSERWHGKFQRSVQVGPDVVC